jgi:hypothetical protein
MSGLKQTRQNAIVDAEHGVSPAGSRWVALYTVAPTATTEGTEVSGGSYARQPITFAAAALGVGASNALVTFPAATAGWGTIVAFAIHDAVSGAGNQRYFKAITPRTVNIGDVAKILSGAITLQVD